MGVQYELVARFPCSANLWTTKLLSDKHYCRKETHKLVLLWIIALLVVNNTIEISASQTDASGIVNVGICPSSGVWFLRNLMEGLSRSGAVVEVTAVEV